MHLLMILVCLTSCIFAKNIDGLEGKESTIAVLDLQDYYNEDKREEFIEEVREALHKVGFFALKNTKVNQPVIDKLYSTLEEFFALNTEAKMKVSGAAVFNQRGYASIGAEKAKGSPVGDYKEYYTMAKEMTKEESEALKCWQNIWPDYMDFQTPAIAFYDEVESYSIVLEEIFSLALGQEKDFLGKICKNGDNSCRLIHYLADEEGTMDSEAHWARAHTDIDAWTILPKSTAEGLEVCDSNGNWIPVFVKEDAFVVNAGDFLEQFSNGYFKSSLHRVVQPEDKSKERYSSVFFTHPRSECLIYPLQCWIEKTGGKAKYIKATRLEMLMERLADLGFATDDMLKSLAETKVLERLSEVGRASPEAVKAVCEAGYGSEELKAWLKQN